MQKTDSGAENVSNPQKVLATLYCGLFSCRKRTPLHMSQERSAFYVFRVNTPMCPFTAHLQLILTISKKSTGGTDNEKLQR